MMNPAIAPLDSNYSEEEEKKELSGSLPRIRSNRQLPSSARRVASNIGRIQLPPLQTDYFEVPTPTWVQIVVALAVYVLFVTDVARGGSSLDELPYNQIEPNVYSSEGPNVLPTLLLSRTNDTTTGTTTTTANDTSLLSASRYKFDTSSYGMRAILTQRPWSMDWPTCITDYDTHCAGNAFSPSVAFSMMDNLVHTIVVNDVNTTSYKTMGDTILMVYGVQFSSLNSSISIPQDSLRGLSQRVRFAIRATGRWVIGASSFLTHYMLDQKYWMSTWATYFDGFNSSSPGMDICLDELDRPLFCEKTWADFTRLAPDDSSAVNVGKLWDDISDIAAGLQTQYPTKTLDMTIIETETDPLTVLGGTIVVAHKLYNVIVLYRIQDCVLNTVTNSTVCETVDIYDVRYEGRVLITDALEWHYVTKSMRYFSQIYNIIRLVCLLVGSYYALKATENGAKFEDIPFVQRCKMALRVFFSIPTQVIVYGSFLPVCLYAFAHSIDGVLLYHINDTKMTSVNLFFDNNFDDMVRLLAVRMRSVWVMAFIARIFIFIQTSGAWTPANGVTGLRGFMLPMLSFCAIGFVLRNSAFQDARMLDTNSVEPAITFMYIRAETMDNWKMNAAGLYNDAFAITLTFVLYFILMTILQIIRRWRANLLPKESIITGHSDVPFAAGYLWGPSCLVVCWEHTVISLLEKLLVYTPQGPTVDISRDPDTDGAKPAKTATGEGVSVVTRSVLMNIAFLSDPWNFLTMRIGHTRVHLFELVTRKRKILHPYSKARLLREYEINPDDLQLVDTFNTAELTWEQLITCK